MIVMAPRDENELQHMLWSALTYGHPAAVRFPKGPGPGAARDGAFKTPAARPGRGPQGGPGPPVRLRQHGPRGPRGGRGARARPGSRSAVVNARFAKPLDEELILRYAQPGRTVITVEEGVLAGGLGSAVRELLDREKRFDIRFKAVGIPLEVYPLGKAEEIRRALGLDAAGLAGPDPDLLRLTDMKERADKLLAARGLAPSREKAQALIMAGLVAGRGPGRREARRPHRRRTPTSSSRKRCPSSAAAASSWPRPSTGSPWTSGGKTAVDVGASTGGFTDCLLQRGARKVYAVDVDTDQLDWKLRGDPRVVMVEKNARYLAPGDIAEPPDVVTVDVSFISLLKVLPALQGRSRANGSSWPWSSRSSRPAGARSERRASSATRPSTRPSSAASPPGAGEIGFALRGLIACSTRGQKGNVEFFARFGRTGPDAGRRRRRDV